MLFRTAIIVLLLSTISGCGGSQPLPDVRWNKDNLPRTASDKYWASCQMVGNEQGQPHLVVLEIKAPDLKPCLNMPAVIDGGLAANGIERARPSKFTVIYNDKAGNLKEVPGSDEAAKLFAMKTRPTQAEVTKFWESLNP